MDCEIHHNAYKELKTLGFIERGAAFIKPMLPSLIKSLRKDPGAVMLTTKTRNVSLPARFSVLAGHTSVSGEPE